jgi:hypothetical protein
MKNASCEFGWSERAGFGFGFGYDEGGKEEENVSGRRSR